MSKAQYKPTDLSTTVRRGTARAPAKADPKPKGIPSILLALFLMVPSLGCNSSTVDWSVLPEYLAGGIVVYGDSRTGHQVHKTLVEGMATISPAAVFHTGDLVDDGRDAGDWITFNRIMSELPGGTPVYPALGNHEQEARLYFDNFELPGNERWYSVDSIDGLNFVVLDTESNLAPGSTQYLWLDSELSSSVSATDYTVVTFHYPLFSTGKHRSDEKGIAADLIPLFELYGVDVVFNGHDHDYERSRYNGILYIVTGGGGAPLRNQAETSEISELFLREYHFCVLFFDEEQKLTVEVWSHKAVLLDSFVIEN